MATPSLTSAGLWCDTVTVSSSQTLTLKIGIWTKINNSSSSRVTIDFTGAVAGMFNATSSQSIGENSFIYVVRII